jgi:molecular chaperone DnaK
MVHAVRKTLKDAGDKVSDSEKESIEASIKELEEALEGSDKEDIEAKTQKLTEVSSELAQKMYADQADQAQQAGGQEEAPGQQSDDAVDAEFEEVKDDDKR